VIAHKEEEVFLADSLFALAVGLLLTVIFTAGFRTRGPWGVWWAFLLVVVLSAWVGGVWVRPVGPLLFGVNWLPLLSMGILFAVLLAAVVPFASPRTRAEAVAHARDVGRGLAEQFETRQCFRGTVGDLDRLNDLAQSRPPEQAVCP
jgi:hypothetical protein